MQFRYLGLLGCLAATIPQMASAEVIISPRFSYYFDNINQRSSGLEDAAQADSDQLAEQNQQLQDLFGSTASINVEPQGAGVSNDQIALPMFGLAATLVDGDWSYTLTGMYGEADGAIRANSSAIQTFNLFGQTATDVLALTADGVQQSQRIDVEFTAQKRINERFAVMGGIRYEHVDSNANSTANISISSNATNLINNLTFAPPEFQLTQTSLDQTIEASYEVYSLRGGVAGYIPFGEGNTVFLNGMMHLSHEPAPNIIAAQEDVVTGNLVTAATTQTSETTLGPDLAVGMQLSLAENISFDIRYRGAFYFPVAGSRSFQDPRVNHGVNAGVSFLF